MKTVLSHCPSCGDLLTVKTLHCPGCGLDLHNDFALSQFDYLSPNENAFLICFLRNQGNMKALCEEIGISFPTAKRQYEKLMIKLGITEQEYLIPTEEEQTMNLNTTTSRASEIIKNRLIAAGGKATVHSINGKAYEIFAGKDGKSFSCEALPITPPYTYDVFDVIVNLLISKGGRADKGNGRNYRLGEPQCSESTVVGCVAKYYMGQHDGESIYDPVFVLSSVLDWAGIARNCRGYIELTPEYTRLLKSDR